ncbi:hypothetical protein MSAN_02160600 [Mycena sanguinolenta]|uniref:Protein CPL1-like domain-containing protein n=1 Tax=Mycena sanguinolenta TaxID=230812 RepID=A0A8H7CL93_9AGAR|nr:hypothetical protein MSAN_02160600 [Mycena sanguinolenta]
MTVITRLGAILLLAAAALPFVASKSVSSDSCRSTRRKAVVYLTVDLRPLHLLPKVMIALPPIIIGIRSRAAAPRRIPLPRITRRRNAGMGGLGTRAFTCAFLRPPSQPTPPASHPSGGSNWKRQAHKRSAPLCPTGLDACPIPGGAVNDYECIDTAVELESCGGCASLDQGQDCTAIPGAWNVGCEQGRCAGMSLFFCLGYRLICFRRQSTPVHSVSSVPRMVGAAFRSEEKTNTNQKHLTVIP